MRDAKFEEGKGLVHHEIKVDFTIPRLSKDDRADEEIVSGVRDFLTEASNMFASFAVATLAYSTLVGGRKAEREMRKLEKQFERIMREIQDFERNTRMKINRVMRDYHEVIKR